MSELTDDAQNNSECAERELSEFKAEGFISKGSYGKVYLASLKKGDGNKLYAMKVIRKDKLDSRSLINSTRLELNILKMTDSPFLQGADYFF